METNRFAALSVEETQEGAVVTSLHATRPTPPEAPYVPLSITDADMSKEFRLQDEYVLAKYCLFNDIQPIEDFIVLQLVRYAMDQKNSATIGFLIDSAIDIVSRMEAAMVERLDPDGHREDLFWNLIAQREQVHVINSSPLIRMQCLISRMALEGRNPFFDQFRMFFDSGRVEYLTLPAAEQEEVEEEYLRMIQDSKPPKDRIEYEPFITASIGRVLSNVIDAEQPSRTMVYIKLSWAFAIRLGLLSTLILRDAPVSPLADLDATVAHYGRLDMRRQDFWTQPEHMMPSMKQNQEQRSAMFEAIYDRNLKCESLITSSLRTSFAVNPQLCAINDSYIRMTFALESLEAIEITQTSRLCIQMWNLLSEEGVLEETWPDADFLMRAVGEKFIFQDLRPTLSKGRGALHERILYGMGLKPNEVKKALAKRGPGGSFRFKRALRRHFDQDRVALFKLLAKRSDHRLDKASMYIDNTELIVTSKTVAPILGVGSVKVQMTNEATIRKRKDLWKLVDKGPRLQPVQLLHVTKRCLEEEMKLSEFNYLRFEEACTELVEEMYTGLNTSESSPFRLFVDLNLTIEKIQYMIMDLLHFQHRRKLETLSLIFRSWLVKYGSVGVAKDMADTKPSVLFTFKPKPQLLRVVEQIVERGSLVEDTFTPAQLQAIGNIVSPTGSVKGMIRATWEEHKRKRKG